MNKNFLNNQNYILGKTEKKKLLSKFFVEKSIKIFYLIISYIKYIISFIILLYILIKLSDYDKEGVIIGNFLLFVLYIIFAIKNKTYTLDIEKISNIKDFFLIKSFLISFISIFDGVFSKNSDILIKRFNNFNNIKNKLPIYYRYLNIFIYGFSIIYLIVFIFNNVDIDSDIKVGGLFILLLLSNIVNIYSIMLLPLLFLIILFVGLFSLINFFIFKGIEKYKFIKLHPKRYFFTKFEVLEINNAENKYYKISLK